MTKAEARDLNLEFQDTSDRLYAYDFDYRMHGYMLRTFGEDLPQGRALELGCYEGAFTCRLAPLFSSLTVVEGSSELIAKARDAAPRGVEFVQSRFETFEPSAEFDAIFLIHTLEHLDDPITLLKRIRAWLTPTGRLFLVVPNAYAASRQIAVEMGLIESPTAVTPGERAHGHRRTYCRSTLNEDVRASGLTPVREGGIFFKPFANFQFDRLVKSGAVGEDYLEGCYRLGARHPEMCASIFVICARSDK